MNTISPKLTKENYKKGVKHIYLDFLKSIDVDKSFGFTFNMIQHHPDYRIKLDKQISVENFRNFKNRLGSKVYGRREGRPRGILSVYPVLENKEYFDRLNTWKTNYHYHGIIEIPKFKNGNRVDKNEFKKLMIDCWNKTVWGKIPNYELHLNEMIKDLDSSNPSGYMDYIHKKTTINEDDNQPDWENLSYVPE